MKVIIEHDGYRMEISDPGLTLETHQRRIEVPCPGATDCGYVHYEPLGRWRVDLSGELAEQPEWVEIR